MIEESFLEYYEPIYNFINDKLLPKYDDLVSFSMHIFSNKDFAMNYEYIFKYKFTEESLKLIESEHSYGNTFSHNGFKETIIFCLIEMIFSHDMR